LRIVGAVLELNCHKGQRSGAGVLQIKGHSFATVEAEMLGVSSSIPGLDDLTVGVVAAGLPVCRGSPEVVEDIVVKSNPLARSKREVPDADTIRFRDQFAPDPGTDLSLFQFGSYGLRSLHIAADAAISTMKTSRTGAFNGISRFV
jgi:hypothetical protein